MEFYLQGKNASSFEIISTQHSQQFRFWFGEKVQTIDCGDEAATWFSQVILGQPSGVRLGCFVQSLVPARSIQGAYKGIVKAYSKLHSGYLVSRVNIFMQ